MNYLLGIPICEKKIGIKDDYKCIFVEFTPDLPEESSIKEALSRFFLKEISGYKAINVFNGPLYPFSDVIVFVYFLIFENENEHLKWITLEELEAILSDQKAQLDLMFVFQSLLAKPFITDGYVVAQKVSSSLYKIDNNDILLTHSQVIELFSALSGVDKKEIASYLSKHSSIITKLGVKGTVVNIYEVDYPPPKDPYQETQQMMKYLDEYEDFITQQLYPGVPVERVIVDVIHDDAETKNTEQKTRPRNNRSFK